MTKEEINNKIEEMGFDGEFLLADGFEDAFIGVVGGAFGVASGSAQLYKLCYDANKCIKILMERDGMEEGEAIEFFEFNTLGAYVGDATPMFIWRHEN